METYNIGQLTHNFKLEAKACDLGAFKLIRILLDSNYFVKLDFEIGVDQQTRARDRTFEGVPDFG